MLWWALGLLAVFGVMGIAIGTNPASPFTQPLDDWWRAMNGVAPDSGAYTWLVPMFFQQLGELPGFVVTALLVPALLTVIGRWRSALFCVSIVLVGPGLLSQLMKNLIDRPRPAADEAAGLFGPLFSVDHGSFPSGHAIGAAALVVGIAALIPPTRALARGVWWVLGAFIMIGMAWQRTLVNAHWLSDTLTGLLVGTAAALLMWWAFWPWLHSDYGRPITFLHTKRKVTP